MLIQKRWYKHLHSFEKDSRYAWNTDHYRYDGWFLFGFIPLYVKRTTVFR